MAVPCTDRERRGEERRGEKRRGEEKRRDERRGEESPLSELVHGTATYKCDDTR